MSSPRRGSAESVSSKSALHFALLDSRIALLSGFLALVRILSSPLLLMGSSQRVVEQCVAKSCFHWQSQLCQNCANQPRFRSPRTPLGTISPSTHHSVKEKLRLSGTVVAEIIKQPQTAHLPVGLFIVQVVIVLNHPAFLVAQPVHHPK